MSNKKNDYLWESMFAVAQPQSKKLDYKNLTAEEFLEYYLERQRKKKRLKYIRIVESKRGRALAIARKVVERRREGPPEAKEDRQHVKKPVGKPTSARVKSDLAVIHVDAGTINNGQTGKQETRIAATDAKGNLLFDVFIGDRTNNEGEIIAISYALSLGKLLNKPLNIYSDSKIALKWAREGKTKGAPDRDPLAAQAHILLFETRSKITWVNREKNKAGIYLENKYSV